LHELYRALHEGTEDEALAAARAVGASARAAGAEVVVVSACLLGERTRYDGGDKLIPQVVDPLLADPRVRVLPLCPEILGGMGCPRRPVHFTSDAPGARVVDDLGVDRTAELERGAVRAAALAEAAGAARAILKERSPSCGVHTVHAGEPPSLVPGRGAFASRLHLPILQSEEDVLKR
jgi:uncharacterized protein YbbK (DUF523 family)